MVLSNSYLDELAFGIELGANSFSFNDRFKLDSSIFFEELGAFGFMGNNIRQREIERIKNIGF